MSETSRAFELLLAVQPADIDQLGHVNNVTYVRWIQEVAVAHWRALASPEDQAAILWVVLRHEIDYKHPALLNDGILARTWVGAASRLQFERHTELLRAADRRLLVAARTMWCPVDAKSGRPTNVRPGLRALFTPPDSPTP